MDFRRVNSYLNLPLLQKKVRLLSILLVAMANTFGWSETVEVKSDSIPALKSDSLHASLDSTSVALDSAGVPPNQLYEYIANPMLQVVTWPLQNVFAPGVKLALYPTKAPLRYLLNENVIDRTIRLISFGNDDKIMLYPTLNLAPGTGSYTGLTFRHKALFGRTTESLVAKGSLYVNGDWKFRTYLNATQIAGTKFNNKFSMLLTRVKNTSVNQPGTNRLWFYADTSNTFSSTLSHKLFGAFGMKGGYLYRDNHFGEAPAQKDGLESPFFMNDSGLFEPQSRGLNKAWVDQNISVSLFRDTRINQNIPLIGSTFDALYHYHFTSAHHNFQGWEGSWNGYYKLGKEKFEISSEEERKSGGLSIKKIMQRMEYERLKHGILNRKVLVTHAYLAQVYEVSGNRMPVYGLRTLGNDTPMRGYSGSRFRDYAVASFSAEYRFPIMRIVDGVLFNEYGVYGRSLDNMDLMNNLRNSWGFGIRVRRPDIYLFRTQLGFHGMNGITLNMSVDEPF